MKLSDFFRDIAIVWNQKTLIGIGFLAFAFGLGVYGGYRLAFAQQNAVVVYSVFIIALLLSLGVADVNGAYTTLINPVALAVTGALSGAGVNVYERLHR